MVTCFQSSRVTVRDNWSHRLLPAKLPSELKKPFPSSLVPCDQNAQLGNSLSHTSSPEVLHLNKPSAPSRSLTYSRDSAHQRLTMELDIADTFFSHQSMVSHWVLSADQIRAVHRARITVNLPGTERFGPVRLRNHSTRHESEIYGNYRTEPLKYGRHAGGTEKI